MRKKFQYLLAFTAFSIIYGPSFAQQVKLPTTSADIAGVPAGTVMTKEYVETIAQFAYLWGWPLVNNLNRSLAVAKLPEPGRIC